MTSKLEAAARAEVERLFIMDADPFDVAAAMVDLARKFAADALRRAIPYDTEHPDYSSEEYNEEIAEAIKAAENE